MERAVRLNFEHISVRDLYPGAESYAHGSTFISGVNDALFHYSGDIGDSNTVYYTEEDGEYRFYLEEDLLDNDLDVTE